MKRLLLLFSLLAIWCICGIDGQGGRNIRKECQKNQDCPPYHTCFYSIWIGWYCVTNLKEKPGAVSCLNLDENNEKYPAHSVCARKESERNGQDTKFSTSRCFAELNFTCAKAAFSPCTPNYNEEAGTPVSGQEQSCPENFRCLPQKFKAGEQEKDEADETGHVTREVCKPVEPETGSLPDSVECETPFDCGYSDLTNGWPKCRDGKCERALQ